eukprot:scaffold24250_cov61-Attheya_sp.AAC.6
MSSDGLEGSIGISIFVKECYLSCYLDLDSKHISSAQNTNPVSYLRLSQGAGLDNQCRICQYKIDWLAVLPGTWGTSS